MVVDSDYRGEVKVALHNDTDEMQMVPAGSRIAQLVVMGYARANFEVVDNLNETERGDNGFGSTGTVEVIKKRSPQSNTIYEMLD